jgi:acyl carrier protein
VSLHSEPLSEYSIQRWLVNRITAIAQINPEEVDVERPFAEFGLDSIQLFQISGDLQEFLGQNVSEIVAWDYPTIAKLSCHLSSSIAGVAVSSPMVVPEEWNT